MKIPFIDFHYDYYYNQFICGFGLVSSKIPRGIIYWKRLTIIEAALNYLTKNKK